MLINAWFSRLDLIGPSSQSLTGPATTPTSPVQPTYNQGRRDSWYRIPVASNWPVNAMLVNWLP